MYIYGGYSQERIEADLWAYNLAQQTWTLLCNPCLPGANYGMAMHTISPNIMMMFGGAQAPITSVFMIDLAPNKPLFTQLNLTIDPQSQMPGAFSQFASGISSGLDIFFSGGQATEGVTSNSAYTARIGCNAGSYSANITATGCTLCPVGTYSADSGWVSCASCPPQTSTLGLGASSVQDCDQCSRALCNYRGSCHLKGSSLLIPTCDCDFGHTGSQCVGGGGGEEHRLRAGGWTIPFGRLLIFLLLRFIMTALFAIGLFFADARFPWSTSSPPSGWWRQA
eukprot:m.271684 g.271684  ORF g.271684 m.271684 type:complete len:281 (+) comp11084_c0_seq63:1906-2748(+)